MTLTIEAIYENGVLKPKQPLPLQEHEAVTVIIVPRVGNVIQEAANGQDPLEGVLGICDDGPDISLAARHDELVYGVPMDEEPTR